MAILKKKISDVKVNTLFSDITENEYSLTPYDLAHDLAELSLQWKNAGYVEIYSKPTNGKLGQVKPSEYNDKGHFVYQYCDVFHGRVVRGANDPLVVIKFTQDPDDTSEEYLSMRFLATHEQLFGDEYEKQSRDSMTTIRNKADKNLQKGDGQDPS